MAITLIHLPDEISSAYNKLKFSVSSDAILDDLRVKARIEYSRNGSTFTSLGQLYGNKNIINGTFDFDVSNRLKSTLDHDYFDLAISVLISDTPHSIVAYKLTFTEQYSNSDGLQEDFDTITSNIFYACNSKILRDEPQNLERFIVEDLGSSAASSEISFLTHSPLITDIRQGEFIQLSFLSNLSTNIHAKIKVKAASETTHSIIAVATTLKRGALLINIDDYYSSDLQYLEVWLSDVNDNRLTEVRRFVIKHLEGLSYHRLTWLNKKGGFDAYTFVGSDSENVEYIKLDHDKYLPDSYSRADSVKGVFSSEVQTTKNGSSMWTSLNERRWLSGLFSSSNVWLIDQITKERISIKILNKSYQIKDDRRLLQVPVQFEFDTEKIK